MAARAVLGLGAPNPEDMFFCGPSDKKLLQNFYTQLAKNKPHFELFTYKRRFAKLKTNLERINYVYKDLLKYSLFPKYIKSKKCDTHAKIIRRNGNGRFAESLHTEAMLSYTQSIAFAETPREQALSYANRSACLYKLLRYEDCIEDIDRAFAMNYPESLKSKLMDRRKNAENQLKDCAPSANYYEKIPEIEDGCQHPKISCASNSVDIAPFGQYESSIIATKDINVGDIISVEKPFASGLITPGRIQHCDFCLELCYNPIPCKTCSLMLYCGENCRDQAFESYHKIECEVLLALIICGVTFAEVIALRIAIKAKIQDEKAESLDVDDNFYRSDRYKEVSKLYAGNGIFELDNLLLFSIISSYMIYYLTNYSTFFDNADKDKYYDIIFLQLQITLLHSIGVEENVYSLFGLHKAFAFGIYPFSSLYNHCSNPNVEKICYGNTIVVRSIQTIKKGQQCYLSCGFRITFDAAKDAERTAYQDTYSVFYNCEICNQQYNLIDYFNPYDDSLHRNISLNSTQIVLMRLETLQNDLRRAKNSLPNLLNKLAKLEEMEPWNTCALLKNAIIKYFRILGNKRII